MKRLKLWGGLAALVLSISGLAIAGVKTNTPATQASDVKVLSVTAKKPSFTITLPANATTGYAWYLVRSGRYVQAVKQHYLAPTSEIVGAPGHSVWTFKVLPRAFDVPRRMKVVLTYTRGWEAETGRLYRVIVVTSPE